MSNVRVFVCPKELLRPNEIPSVSVAAETLAEAWESAVLATLDAGCQIPTEYDQDFDPQSRVVTMQLLVAKPFAEPRIHKCMPDSFEGLEMYVQEVVAGVHDGRIREGGWSYSYHDRLRRWPGIDGYAKLPVDASVELPRVDQIDEIIQHLARTPHTRRAQAIVWNPLMDAGHHEPPCLQRIWCQLVRSEGDALLLEMNTHWRSRDAFKAAFMNIFAITELQRQMAQAIGERLGRPVEVGRYCDMTDNFHIYGSYIRRGEMDAFLQSIQKRSFAERTMRSDDPLVLEEFAQGRERLRREAE
jgi:thymidylate synthase